MANLISVTEAQNIILQLAKTLGKVNTPIAHAHGHVLAQDACAQVSLPPLDASAMDGYAICLEPDHGEGSIFTLIGEAPAGAPFAGTVGKDECVRIFTGGAVPPGANHVIMQENVDASGAKITLTQPISPASHIRKAGIDFAEGDVILKQGCYLGAYEIALLSAANHGHIHVYKRPKLAIIANGDELIEPGETTTLGSVISSNPYGLAPLIEAWGAEAIFTNICKDDPKEIQACIESLSDADILLPIGGASVGDRDYMRSVFNEMGFVQSFAKVAVKPGKPVWCGKLGAQYVLGLPGNPASALVTAQVFLKPLILALNGILQAVKSTVTAQVTTPMPASTWRTEYIRASADIDPNGTLQVTPYPRQDSSLITPFITANCLLVRKPQAPALSVGDKVDIMFLKSL